MKHALYEHPVTHQFALIRLPPRFAEGDAVPASTSSHWFASREQALAALPELFDEDEDRVNEESQS